MKYIYLLIIIVVFSSCGSSWTVVDYASMSSMVETHSRQHKKYEAIKNEEAQKMGLQASLKRLQGDYTEITEKLRKRTTEVTQLFYQAGKVPLIISMVNEIRKYQAVVIKTAVDKPSLIRIAIAEEIAIGKRVNKLLQFIYLNAVIGGDVSIMSIKQRLECIDKVIEELKIIRGISFGVKLKMEWARDGIETNNTVGNFDFKRITRNINKQQIINQLVN